jgi:hypothetical protein
VTRPFFQALTRRKATLVAGALLAAVTLSSCATFTDNANAARVGDVELPRADLEQYVQEALAAQDSTDGADELQGDGFRQIIASWVVDEIIRQKLAIDGESITPADIQTAETQLAEQLAGFEVPEFLRQFEITSMSTRAAYQRVQAELTGEESQTLIDYARTVSVYVDPYYGYWDIESGVVQPLGS